LLSFLSKEELAAISRGLSYGHKIAFGFLGFRKHLAWNENLCQTNGLMLWKLNDVSYWLEQK